MPETNGKFKPKIRLRLKRKGWETLLTIVSLILIFMLAIIARLGPMKYTFQIAEVDPWFYYFSSHYMLINGPAAWFHWVNQLEWYPYGQKISLYDDPMLGLFSSSTYRLVQVFGLNMSFYDYAVYLPVFVTAIATIFMYFFGREIGGKKTGLLAALLLALSPANIQQTMLGEFKEEFIAFFFLVPSLYFLFRSFRTKKSVDMLASGVLLSGAVASWGPVSPYMYDLPALIVLVGVLADKISPSTGFRLLAFVCAPALFTAAIIPRDVSGISRIGEESPVFAAFLIAMLRSYYNSLKVESRQLFKAFSVIIVVLIIAGSGLLLHSALGGRILAIVFPFARSLQPIVNTVAENELTTWADFYVGFNIQMILLPVAVYLFYRKKDAAGIAMVLYIVSATYATASYVRAEEILTPFAAVAAAYVISRLIDSYAPLISKAYKTTSSNKKANTPVDWEIGGILIVLLVISVGFFAYQGLVSGNSSPLMMTVNGQFSNDWPQALTWLKYNTPTNAVVASWWDYGYWIMVGANRTTIADPSTTNTTQIQYLAIALMSNTTVAEKIFHFYHVDYLLIYQPIASVNTGQGTILYPSFDGDLGKSTAMLTIAASTNFQKFNQIFGLNLSKSQFNQSKYLAQIPNTAIFVPSGQYGGQATLFNLMFGSNQEIQYSLSQLAAGQVQLPTFQVPQGFQLVYETPDQAILIYSLNYAAFANQSA